MIAQRSVRTVPAHPFVRIGLLLLLPLLHALPLTAQEIDYSVANEFRYGIGEQFQNETAERKEYLENLLNARIFVGNFRLGFRAQLDRPREFGPDTVGITQYFAEFQKEGLTARAGTFYHLVGRGLVFNTFESRPVGFNTLTEGVNIDYKRDEFRGGVYGGVMNYASILDEKIVEQYLVRGAWGEARPISEIGIGASFLAASGEKTRTGFRNEFDAYLREGYVEANADKYSLYFNWADKRTHDTIAAGLTSSPRYGTGWYGKLGYTGDFISVTAEYKDYRFDLVRPPDRDVGTRSTRALPFQNGPTLVPEHDKTLLGRNPHTIDFNDELGFQVSGIVYPSDKLTVNLLATAASRHAAYDAVVVTDTAGAESIEHRLVGDKRLSFPELSDDRYSPYWEVFAQGDLQVTDDLDLSLAAQRKENIIYYDRTSVANEEAIAERYRTTTGMVEATYQLSRANALHAIVEVQGVFDSKKISVGVDSLGITPSDGRFLNTLFTLEFSHSPQWSANARLEWTSTDKEQEGRRIWPVVGGSYRIGRSHTIAAQYGWERGGIVCTGGVCRFINPFTGFRLSIVSKL